jgi:hypothetical protein
LPSLSNRCLTYDLDCARVRLMIGALHPGRERICVIWRAGGAPLSVCPVAAAPGALLRS